MKEPLLPTSPIVSVCSPGPSMAPRSKTAASALCPAALAERSYVRCSNSARDLMWRRRPIPRTHRGTATGWVGGLELGWGWVLRFHSKTFFFHQMFSIFRSNQLFWGSRGTRVLTCFDSWPTIHLDPFEESVWNMSMFLHVLTRS